MVRKPWGKNRLPVESLDREHLPDSPYHHHSIQHRRPLQWILVLRPYILIIIGTPVNIMSILTLETLLSHRAR
jgi:hypothetical protein